MCLPCGLGGINTSAGIVSYGLYEVRLVLTVADLLSVSNSYSDIGYGVQIITHHVLNINTSGNPGSSLYNPVPGMDRGGEKLDDASDVEWEVLSTVIGGCNTIN